MEGSGGGLGWTRQGDGERVGPAVNTDLTSAAVVPVAQKMDFPLFSEEKE